MSKNVIGRTLVGIPGCDQSHLRLHHVPEDRTRAQSGTFDRPGDHVHLAFGTWYGERLRMLARLVVMKHAAGEACHGEAHARMVSGLRVILSTCQKLCGIVMAREVLSPGRQHIIRTVARKTAHPQPSDRPGAERIRSAKRQRTRMAVAP